MKDHLYIVKQMHLIFNIYIIQLSTYSETARGSDSDGADPQVTYWKNQCFQSTLTEGGEMGHGEKTRFPVSGRRQGV